MDVGGKDAVVQTHKKDNGKLQPLGRVNSEHLYAFSQDVELRVRVRDERYVEAGEEYT